MSSPVTLKVMPSQKKSDKEKIANDKQWGKECIDAMEGMVLLQNDFIRSSRYRKQINYELYNGKLHPSDIEKIMNPMGLKNVTFPAKMMNHPITNPYIQCLVGDEINRRFDWSLKVTNDDAISEKEKEKNEIVQEALQAMLLKGLEQPDLDPNDPQAKQIQQEYEQEVAKRLELLDRRVNQNFQDKREIAGTHLLNYYQRYLNIKNLRTRGWLDALIVGEEIYCVDIMNNEPTVRKCNPSNTYFLIAPDSYMVEEADGIVEEYYVPLARVIDDYYDVLTSKDIEYLESKTRYKGQAGYGGLVNYELQDPQFAIPLGATHGIDINTLNTGATGLTPFDTQNNVRVCKVVWRSLRKVGLLTYLDDTGVSQEKIVHEDYTVNRELGESIRYIWIGEWWEGTKIANEIYVKIQPRPIQFRSLNNISKCASGYVGSLYKDNASMVQSLFDLMKPYQYKYNVYYHRLEKLFINNIGKIAKLDLAKVPDGWHIDKWLYYAKEMNIAVVDSFKEAKKGAATGKLAGNMADNSNVIDLSLGTEIQQHIQALEYIKQELDLITGINPARRGQVKSADQGLGVTQESINASAVITEYYFSRHDETGLRLMATLLETAKYCLRNGNKNIQYVTDEMDAITYQLDGELINEAEYGLNMVNSSQDAKARQSLQAASELAMQTGQLDLIQMMDVNSNESFASIKNKITKSVREKQEREAQAAQEENKIRQQELADRKLLEQQKLELERYKIDVEAQTKIHVAELSALAFDEGPSPVPLEDVAGNALKQQEILNKKFEADRKHLIEQSKIQSQEKIKREELSLREKELKLKEAETKSKEKIEKLKAETALKVARENKTKAELNRKKK